uniref:Uncharacterized protein n=1 Tax=Anguilla anguilla TaxID=7936 RepID=A0A0E9RMI3_ANGAN
MLVIYIRLTSKQAHFAVVLCG